MNRHARHDQAGHTPWCARDHRCGIHLGEHQSPEIVVALPGAGRAVLTRVRAADGREHADIRLRLTLPASDPAARARLAALVTGLRAVICPSTKGHFG